LGVWLRLLLCLLGCWLPDAHLSVLGAPFQSCMLLCSCGQTRQLHLLLSPLLLLLLLLVVYTLLYLLWPSFNSCCYWS
jgi:hypothetical protein